MRAAIAGAALLLPLIAAPSPAAADPPAPPVTAPLATPAPVQATQIRSQGMLAGGVALTFFGGLGATTGAVLLLASSFGCPEGCEDSASRSRALGGPLLGIGAAMLAGGIVLIVIGNQKVPAQKAAIPSWLGAPSAAGWAFRF